MNSWIKTLRISIFTIFIATMMVCCSAQKEYVISSDYSYAGKFKKYKTFEFTDLSENDSLYLKSLIEESIANKMNSQGYRLDGRKPDLFITYKLYLDDFNLRGYDQPTLESWVFNEWEEKLMKNGKFIEPTAAAGVSADYDAEKYLMSKGTLLITFYDRKYAKTVWQGYASGVFSSQFDSNEKNIKIATAKIFKQFRLIANGYVMRKGA